MAGKRKITTETPTPSVSKRQRVADPTSPTTQTPSRPQKTLTAEEKSKLVDWLDKKNGSTGGMPFPIALVTATPKTKKGKSHASTSVGNREHLVLDGHEYGTVEYNIGNKAKWEELTKFRKCTVGNEATGDETLEPGQCILVKGDTAPEADPDDPDASLKMWKAQLHEVRAINENHVYLRITWLYRPHEDLPEGPAPYHGRYELIPSTEMQVIDAMSVNGSFPVKYWDEYKDDDEPETNGYFWRQSYNRANGTLSACRIICACHQPQNPDHPIFQCQHCSEWMHAACIEKEAVRTIGGEEALAELETAEKAGTETGKTMKGRKKAKTKGTGPGKKANEEGTSEALVVATLKFISPTSNCKTGDDSISQSQHGSLRIVTVDRRGDEPVEDETKVDCLFCGKNMDG